MMFISRKADKFASPVMGANNRDSIDTVYGGAKAKFGDSDDKAVEFLEAGEMEDLPPPLCSADSAVLEDRIKDVMKQRIDGKRCPPLPW